MLKQRVRRRPIADINVVPYIDVMLVLLIIFMVTTPLLSQGVQVSLPKTQSRAIVTDNQEPIIISVDAKGQLYLNIVDKPDMPLPPQQLALRVAAEMNMAKRQQQTRLVLVKGDKEANYGNVVQAMALLQRAGVDNVGLMTDINDQSTPTT